MKEPQHIIQSLRTYQSAYLDLVNGTNIQNLPKSSRRAIRRFFDLGFPSSAIPFLMQISKGMAEGTVDYDLGVQVLNVVEAFLVRRAICGIEPTGLHAVFKRLWNDVAKDLSPDLVKKKIKERKTVAWPSDHTVKNSVKSRHIDKSAVAPFLIRQFDESLGGDVPDNVPWIEHVLPQNPVDGWYKKFSKRQAKELHRVWSNLIPLSSEMNNNLRNDVYAKKRARYESDAMFKSAREFAKTYGDWTPQTLSKRSELLAEWTVSRWPE